MRQTDEEKDTGYRPSKFAIAYYDYVAEQKVYLRDKDGNLITFSDIDEAEDYAWFYSRTEGVYAGTEEVRQ